MEVWSFWLDCKTTSEMSVKGSIHSDGGSEVLKNTNLGSRFGRGF